MKIISLVPSLTETLIDLGLIHQLKGRTKFCIRPSDDVMSIPIIGGTKNPRIESIIDLSPDLIIANKEENRKEDIEKLQSAGLKVLVTDIYDLRSMIEAMQSIGNATNTTEKADELTHQVNDLYLQVTKPHDPLRACYLIWNDPMMTIGGDTFISSMLPYAGMTNAFKEYNRYPEVAMTNIIKEDVDIILLSSEPYPFKSHHAEAIQQQTGIKTILVDGEAFSWYGSTVIKKYEYIQEIKRDICSNIR